MPEETIKYFDENLGYKNASFVSFLTTGHARIQAARERGNSFYHVMTAYECGELTSWQFKKQDCLEAAEFFKKLAESL